VVIASQGREAEAAGWFARSAERYRESWTDAPPGSWGRLIGALNAQGFVSRIIYDSAGRKIQEITYVNAPTVLHETWQTRMRPDLFFAGQMSGVEGYVESAASGLIAGRNAAALALGEEPSAPPRTTAIGALAYYASHADPKHYVPSNIAFGLIPPLEQRVKSKKDRNTAISERALTDLAHWLETTSKRFSNISG